MSLTIPERVKLVEELKLKNTSELTLEEKKLMKLERNRITRLEKRHNDPEYNQKCKDVNKKYYKSDKGKEYHKTYYKNRVDTQNYRETLNEKNKIKRQEIIKIIEENKMLKQIISQERNAL